MTKQPFGRTPDGQAVDLYTLTNHVGMEVSVMNYGGIVVSLKVCDRDGEVGDLVLGFDSLDGYIGGHPYFGAIIGRYGNRIRKGRFRLNGTEYSLARNNGENHLHGGITGFDKRIWEARDACDSHAQRLELSYLSKDGEEGYPGNLSVQVFYTLNERNEFRIDYSATTDKDTVVNLTNHSYFNFARQGESDVLGHALTLYADSFTPVNQGLIPTGELRSVECTPFDFRKPTPIGARIHQNDEQLRFGGGYDHNFVLKNGDGSLKLAARVYEPKTRRAMEVLTTEPGIQLYTGNFLDGTLKGKGSKTYPIHSGFCLETQHFPDSPNQPHFPSTLLKAGDVYRTATVYRFFCGRVS